MENERQLYMHINDIKPTETFWDEVDDRPLYTEDARLWTKQEILDSIRRDGLKYQLNVDPQGNIKNGNIRYWACRYLLEHEQDERFRYLPVQRNFATAQFHKYIDITNTRGMKQKEVDEVVEEMALQIVRHWVNQVREQVIPSEQGLPDFEVDTIDGKRLKRFWDVSRNTWALFYQAHPYKPNHVVVSAIFSKGGTVDIMKPDVPQKVKDNFKRWFRDNRDNLEELAKGFQDGKYRVDKIGRTKV